MLFFNGDEAGAIGLESKVETVVIWGEKVGDRVSPFDNNKSVGCGEIFGEIIGHQAGIRETIKIIVNQGVGLVIFGKGVTFGNSKAGRGDRGFDTEGGSEIASKSGFANTNIAN